jgi:hypothetical protein
MQKRTERASESAASLAARILAAYSNGNVIDLPREIARTQFPPQCASRIDTCEAEKRELLAGAVESLNSPRPERVRAAIHLLEHLAKDAVIVLAV